MPSSTLPPGFVSLNKEFNIFRTNALQRRRFRREQRMTEDADGGDEFGPSSDDRDSLLRDHDEESGLAFEPAPSFVGQSEALEYQMSRVEDKVGRLEAAYREATARPNLDDIKEEESNMEKLAKEVTEVS